MNKILFSIGVLSLTTFCFWSNSLAQKVIDLDIGDEDVRILGTDAGGRVGRLATGDINGDGVDDLIISATRANGGTGVVYVIFGATTLPGTINLATADITILGENAGDAFGDGLETGDVNNDNFDDILVGAQDASPSSRAEAGKAYVIFGGSSLPSVIDLSITPADLVILGDDAGDKLGVRVASGDVNDDGIDDFIVGAFQEADPFRPGKVYVVFGNSTLPSLIDLSSQSAAVTILGEAGGDQFGISVWSGDVNGDSVDDILVGANFADTPSGADAGRAYVIYGDSLLPSIIDLSSMAADLTILGNNPNSQFGFPLRSGDVNGDSIEDIVIAACCINAGEIVVIFGSGSLPSTIDLGSTPPDVDILGENAGDIFSGFPFAVKDVNNDMIDDIIAGALLADPSGRTDAGKSYMLSGRHSWPTVIDLSTAPADITIWGDDANDLSGVSIAAGDVNDDGINDIIVGALLADPPGVGDAGEAYIIFGEGPVSVTLTPINPPIQIPAGGGSFQYVVSVTNNTTSPKSFQIWNVITRPNGEDVGPTVGPLSPTLDPGATVNVQLIQNVPGPVPAGTYTYTFNVGTFPNIIAASDSFTFTKLVGPTLGKVASSEISDWVVVNAETREPLNRRDAVTADKIARIPQEFVLEQNYPNPFNPSTTITFGIPEASEARLAIYNLRGQLIRTLYSGPIAAGQHSVVWDGTDFRGAKVANGIYVYQLKSADFVATKKLVFTK